MLTRLLGTFIFDERVASGRILGHIYRAYCSNEPVQAKKKTDPLSLSPSLH